MDDALDLELKQGGKRMQSPNTKSLKYFENYNVILWKYQPNAIAIKFDFIYVMYTLN